MDSFETEGQAGLSYPCGQCGAELKFEPGTTDLVCPYCGSNERIQESAGRVRELNYEEHLRRSWESQPMLEIPTVSCGSCGATTSFDAHVTSEECPYCGSTLIRERGTTRVIQPQALLPFKVGREEANRQFSEWVESRWFAPNDFVKMSCQEGRLQGLYMPYWTYDCRTRTDYTGERGEEYTVEESYTDRDDQGRTVTRTRRVTKVRWYPASGRVRNEFDDVLILASESLPRSYTQALEPWDLAALTDFRNEYLSGFRTESYGVDLQNGFDLAKDRMRPTIERTVERDIGGDRQRIHDMDVDYDSITFKHILLPIWASAYRYRDEPYRFVINARTGEVQGERPWSWIKITLATLAALVVILTIYALTHQGG